MTASVHSLSPALVVLRQAPFTPREYRHYGIAAMLEVGVAVTVLDMVPIANPGAPFLPSDSAALPGVDVRQCHTLADMHAVTPILEAASLVICDIGTGNVDRHTLPILRWLSRAGRPYAIVSNSTVPTSDRVLWPVSFGDRVRKANLARSVLSRLPNGLLGLRPADYVICGGSRSLTRMRLSGPGTRVFWSRAFDQDLADDECALRPLASVTETAVFLDQYFGFHPGAFRRGVGHAVDSVVFYPALRRLFDRIEAELGLEVVIAAHPMADYVDKPDLFGTRRIVHGDTARLVRASRLAVASFSTSVNFAVLFGKPAMIYTTPTIEALGYLHDAPGALARALGTTPVDISEPDAVRFEGIFDVDVAAYERFRDLYIMADRPGSRRIADILLDLCRGEGAGVTAGGAGSERMVRHA